MAHFFKKTANDSQTNESPLEFHINYTISCLPTKQLTEARRIQYFFIDKQFFFAQNQIN